MVEEDNKSQLGKLPECVHESTKSGVRAVLNLYKELLRTKITAILSLLYPVKRQVKSQLPETDGAVRPFSAGSLRKRLGKFGGIGKTVAFSSLKEKHVRITLGVGLLLLVLLIGSYAVWGPNAVTMSLNGEEIGIARSGPAVETAVAELEKEITSQGWIIVDNHGKLSIKPCRAAAEQILSPEVLKERLRVALDWTVQAVAISINANPVVWVKDETTARQVVATTTQSFIPPGSKVLSVAVEEKVEYLSGEVGISQILSPEEAVDFIKEGVPREEQYTAAKGDTLLSIAEAQGVPVEAIQAANPQIEGSSTLQSGQVLKFTKTEPILHVVVTREEEVIDKVDYPVQKLQDDTLYRGQEQVKQEGADGVRAVTYRLVERNGIQVSRKELSNELLKAPIPEVVVQGIKVIAVASRGNADLGPGNASLAWPLRGPINSGYGYRSGGFHGAIDIGASYGTPVRSAANGTVIFTGEQGGYGHTILIDHGNGLVTRYAHLSAIDVKSGQVVEQGDKIGNVGMTGNTTGPHLHFEVISGGSSRNPLEYLP